MSLEKPLIIYKASAGSGKTYNLVKEYLKIALSTGDSNYFKYILAITFTNKAATEMKSRVFEFLKTLRTHSESELKTKLSQELDISKDQLTQRANEMLRNMLYNYSDIAISTIDSFVLKIVRGFSKELGLPYDFDIELDEDRIIEIALDMVIEESRSEEFVSKILNDFIAHRIQEEVSWSFLSELKDFCKTILKDKSQRYVDFLVQIENAELEDARKSILNRKEAVRNDVLIKARALKSFINSLGIELEDMYRGKTGQFYRIEKILQSGIPGIVETQFEKYDVVINDQWFRKGSESENDIAPHKNKIRSLYKEIVDGCKIFSSYQVMGDAVFPMMLISRVAKAIDEIKNTEETLLISDNHRTINRIIQDNPVPFIYEKIGERFRHFMIDEFQDTSVTQFHNLIPLLENSLSQNYRNIIVGDSKQSIYRFREGEAEQIIKLPYEIHRKDELNEGVFRENLIRRTGIEKSLRVNFRSDHEIVVFNNDFFEIISARLGEDYDLDNHFKGFIQEPHRSEGGLVEIQLLEKEDFDHSSLDSLEKNIRICREDGYKLSDIAVLVRDKNQAEKVASHLANSPDLPFISQDSLKFGTHRDLVFIMNILRQHLYKDQMSSGMQILAYLHTPEHELSFHDIAQKCKYKSSEEAYSFDRFDADSCLKYLGIDYVFSNEYSFSLIETIHKIILSFNIEVNNGFIHQMLDETQHFSSRKGHNTAEFIAYWDQHLSLQCIEIPESKNAIHLLSIHKSKGLQYPVVLIPFTNWSAGSKTDHIWVNCVEECPLPFFLVKATNKLDKTIFSDEYREEKNRQLIDHLNLIYVAFTRAKNRLYITNIDKDLKTDTLKSNPSEWINFFVQSTGVTGYGSRTKHDKEPLPSEQLFSFEIPGTNWKQKLVANHNYFNDYLKYEEVKSKRLDGILIHKIFEMSVDEKSSASIIDSLSENQFIDRSEAKILKEKFHNLYSNDAISRKLNISGEVKNEPVLIDQHGNSYRPDRVIFSKDALHIFDLKTGEIKEDHKNQLNHYERLFEEIGYTNIQKHLIYFNSEEIVSWN